MLNRFFRNANNVYIKIFKRYFIEETLKSKCLIRVSGEDSYTFLQSLISNDVECISKCHGCVYSYLLNAKGRILFDIFLYNQALCDEKSVFIECDKNSSGLFQKHLKMYKLRKKVCVDEVPGSVSVILPENDSEDITSLYLSEETLTNKNLLYFGSDPRVYGWCIRIAALGEFKATDSIKLPDKAKLKSSDTETDNLYTLQRHKLGIPEACTEILKDSALPLEYNGDILNAISFNKGCYIGQELTARTYHTGVVRKRILPIKFNPSLRKQLHGLLLKEKEKNLTLKLYGDASCSDQVVGDLRVINDVGGAGLGLVRLSGLRANNKEDGVRECHVYIKGVNEDIIVEIPDWWPKDISISVK